MLIGSITENQAVRLRPHRRRRLQRKLAANSILNGQLSLIWWSQIHEDLLQNGNRGGLELANRLREEVLSLLQRNADSRDWDIIVSFYIDVGTLFAKCVSADIKISEDCLREFACGFTQAQPLFDLVDVGHGREQAVLKIQGTISTCTGLKPELLTNAFNHARPVSSLR